MEKMQMSFEAQAKVALHQLELSYRMSAISGLMANPAYNGHPDMIAPMLKHADQTAKACIATWHGALGESINKAAAILKEQQPQGGVEEDSKKYSEETGIKRGIVVDFEGKEQNTDSIGQ